jgi:hypothetical protein
MVRLDLEGILAQAEEYERRYEWLQAETCHRKALKGLLDKKKYVKAGEVQERIGLCLDRAAFQAETQEEFNDRMKQAVEAYNDAYETYRKLSDGRGSASMLRCKAIAKYLSHWISSDPSEVLRLLDESLEYQRESLTAYANTGDKRGYVHTFSQLPLLIHHRVWREYNDASARIKLIEEGIEWGERSLEFLSHEDYIEEHAWSLFAHATNLFNVTDNIEDLETKEKTRQQSTDYLQRAIDIADDKNDDHLAGYCHLWLGYFLIGQKALEQFQLVTKCGENTNDHLLLGMGYSWQAHQRMWKAFETDDPSLRDIIHDEVWSHYQKAVPHFSTISFYGLYSGVIAYPGGDCEYYWIRATHETDVDKKKDYLVLADEAGEKGVAMADGLGYKKEYTRHVYSKALRERASWEPLQSKKLDFLKKALQLRRFTCDFVDKFHPYDYWIRGVYYVYLAEIYENLEETEIELGKKIELIEEAVRISGNALGFREKSIKYYEKVGGKEHFYDLYKCQRKHVRQLTRLFELTQRKQLLGRIIKVSSEAVESARNVERFSLVAESYWKIAKTQDTLGEHVDAAASFDYASANYLESAERIPQLKEFYIDYSTYMHAWKEIEHARDSHKKKQFDKAEKHYEKAAELHESTIRWNQLNTNYLAWASLERAEGSSRRNQTEEAKGLFRKTATLFSEAEKEIMAKLGTLDVEEEKRSADELIAASKVRHEYCQGRVALEDAKLLDIRGDHLASSKMYRSAADTFEWVMDSSEEAREEMQPLVYLCQAWQKMTQAEAEASPSHYLEASRLFEKVKDSSSDESSKRLALGHSLFCLALEAGAKFESNRDIEFYTEAIRHLGGAAVQYMRAGNSSASEYARATQRLLDAYVYMDNANMETDPQKKAKHYLMAEKTLESSAISYHSAMHPEKSDEVQELLARVRDDRDWAISLIEVTHAPAFVSSTEAFVAPTSTREVAVGLERLEHADVQGNLFLNEDTVDDGENIEIHIELINAGRGTAQLVTIEGALPDGIEAVQVSDNCVIEDGDLEFGGKLLHTLRMEEVSLTLKSMNIGTFQYRPRVVYLDDAGNRKSFTPNPVIFNVTEAMKPKKGRLYLFVSHDRCLKTFIELTQKGEPSLAIIRDDPEVLVEKGDMNDEDIVMLFSRSVRGYEAMSNLQEISRKISQRLHQGVKLVLLDGLEYLISRFGFDSVFSFLQEKRLNILEADAIMLLPFDFETVTDRQRAQLRSEVEIIN